MEATGSLVDSVLRRAPPNIHDCRSIPPAVASSALSEPHVLAHAKRRLFPDAEERGTYAVADTQFAMAEWLHGRAIPPDVREALAPFNHVR